MIITPSRCLAAFIVVAILRPSIRAHAQDPGSAAISATRVTDGVYLLRGTGGNVTV